MQSKASRIALVVAAVAIAVVAFLVLSPSDEEPQQSATTDAQDAPQRGDQPGGDSDQQDGRSGSDGEDDAGEGPTEPQVPTVEVRNGEPVGGVQEIEVESGETAEFAVESNRPDELHVHGYDLYEDVGPGQPARFRFAADLEGIFEVEMHDAGTLVAEVRVTP